MPGEKQLYERLVDEAHDGFLVTTSRLERRVKRSLAAEGRNFERALFDEAMSSLQESGRLIATKAPPPVRRQRQSEWTNEELDASVAAYAQMVKLTQGNAKYNKAQVYRDLAAKYGRAPEAFERRMMNISAVLEANGKEWLKGLAPARNVGSGVAPRIEDALLRAGVLPQASPDGKNEGGVGARRGSMRGETLRQAILRVLSQRNDWVSRQELIDATGHEKGYSGIIGVSRGEPAANTLRHLGWVTVKKVGGKASYRITPLGMSSAREHLSLPALSRDLPNWQKALEALVALGGKSSRAAIHDWLVKRYGSFDMENLRKDLTMLSVNDKGRFAYRAWERRRGRPKVALDLVFAGAGEGPQRTYELFDPSSHGQWEIYRTPKGALDLRVKAVQIDEDLRQAQQATPEFDPADASTGKKRMLREIALRQGGPAFRKKVLQAFARNCGVTGCRVEEILEAAHISPYDGPNTNHVTNGLLLRSDIHTLFDLGLIRIAPKTMKVHVHPRLLNHTEYAAYDGSALIESYPSPSGKALEDHWARHAAKWEQ
jgi:hypothetical protein